MNWRTIGLVGAGVASGIIVNAAWSAWPEAGRFKAKILKATSLTGEPEKSPLAFIEHYHWGLASLALAPHAKPARDLLIGFGASMIASETFGSNPFGAGKTEYEVKGNVMLASLLVGASIISWTMST